MLKAPLVLIMKDTINLAGSTLLDRGLRIRSSFQQRRS